MSSRLEQKAAARRQREDFEAAERQAAQRRRSLYLLAVVAAAALALVAVAVALTRGGDEPTSAAKPGAIPARFAGIPQDGIALGSPQAPATLVEFADLQCPYCGVYGRDVLPSVVDRYVRPGKLRLELNLLTFVGEDSVKAGRMAAAAALQNRLWPFSDAFYISQGQENTGYVTDEFLDSAGAASGVDMGAARDAQGGAAAKKVLSDAKAAAARLGVDSTPSFFVRRGDGQLKPLEVSDLTPDAFAAALDSALSAK